MQHKGFSVIELIVVVLIFLIVSGAVIGVFVTSLRVQRYMLTAQQMLDQTSYAMEYMSRSLRMAKKDEGGSCIDAGGTYKQITGGVQFTAIIKDIEKKNAVKEVCKEFFIQSSDATLQDFEDDPKKGGDEKTLPLTAPNDLKVTNLRVYPPSGGQPRVTTVIEIEGPFTSSNPNMKLQTTISQRDLNVAP